MEKKEAYSKLFSNCHYFNTDPYSFLEKDEIKESGSMIGKLKNYVWP